MWVENCSDDLWVGVKGQSNWEIAGSLRNIFKYRLDYKSCGGKVTAKARGRELTKSLLTLNTTSTFIGTRAHGG